jgi:hypothetical protein
MFHYPGSISRSFFDCPLLQLDFLGSSKDEQDKDLYIGVFFSYGFT